jgi:hypothetical protein
MVSHGNDLRQPTTRRDALLRRKLHGADAATVEEWLTVGPAAWVQKNASRLHDAGLAPSDGAALYRRLGPEGSVHVGSLLTQGLMAGLELRHVHLWAASGLLVPVKNPQRPHEAPSFTTWVTQARRYVAACCGDQQMAAAAAAARLGVEETATMWSNGDLDMGQLATLVALREDGPPISIGLGSGKGF